MEKQMWNTNQWVPFNEERAAEAALTTGELQTKQFLNAAQIITTYEDCLTEEQINQLNNHGKDI